MLDKIRNEEFQKYLRTRKVSLSNLNIVGDELIRFENIKAGRELCKRCDGTGNETFFMFKQCTKCGGSGNNDSENSVA